MTWRPTPPNPAVISDGFKEIGAAYKASVTDNDGSASPARTSGSITVDSDYKCIDLTNDGNSAVLFRIGNSSNNATRSAFDGILPTGENGGGKRIKLPKGYTSAENRISFITVATGASVSATVYVTAYKELS